MSPLVLLIHHSVTPIMVTIAVSSITIILTNFMGNFLQKHSLKLQQQCVLIKLIFSWQTNFKTFVKNFPWEFALGFFLVHHDISHRGCLCTLHVVFSWGPGRALLYTACLAPVCSPHRALVSESCDSEF